MPTAPTAPTLDRLDRSGEAAHVQLRDLVKRFPGQDRAAVDGVSLDLGKGQLLALLGPSGCGKTTTLRMIAGLVEPDSGRVTVDDADITDLPVHRRGMGMVFQSYALFPHLDVARNVAFGLEMRKIGKSERARRVADVLQLVELGHLADRPVKKLSGGQQQRVSLARALVVEPSLLLLDEPLSNLDAKLRDAMRAEIRSIVHRLGVTTVFVTHDQYEALSIADRIAVLNNGRVEQVGTPEEIYERPATRFVADFIGRANLFQGRVVSIDAGLAVVDVHGAGTVQATYEQRGQSGQSGVSVGQDVTLLVRPHRVDIGTAAQSPPEPSEPSEPSEPLPDRLRGVVLDRSYTGEMVSYTVALGERRLQVETLTGFDDPHPVGADVHLSWRATDARVLTDS